MAVKFFKNSKSQEKKEEECCVLECPIMGGSAMNVPWTDFHICQRSLDLLCKNSSDILFMADLTCFLHADTTIIHHILAGHLLSFVKRTKSDFMGHSHQNFSAPFYSPHLPFPTLILQSQNQQFSYISRNSINATQ